MEKNRKNFRQRILTFFDLFENIFALAFAIGIFLLTKEILWSRTVIWVGITGLTFIYLIKSFESPKQNILTYLVYKITWLGYILALFGIYAKLSLLDKSLALIFIALGSLIIALLGSIYLKLKREKIIDNKDYVRMITFIVITFLFAIL